VVNEPGTFIGVKAGRIQVRKKGSVVAKVAAPQIDQVLISTSEGLPLSRPPKTAREAPYTTRDPLGPWVPHRPARHGHLMIEYERPKAFETKSGFERAAEQVKSYIRDHAEVKARFPRYFGVVLDGYKIGFVRYREAVKGFESKGPFDVNRNTIAKLIEAIMGLS
jgi:hypothetical protein